MVVAEQDLLLGFGDTFQRARHMDDDLRVFFILDKLTEQFGDYQGLASIRHAAEESDDLFIITISGDRTLGRVEAQREIRILGEPSTIRTRIEAGPPIEFAAYPVAGDPKDPLGSEKPVSKAAGAPYSGGDRIMNGRSDALGNAWAGGRGNSDLKRPLFLQRQLSLSAFQ